MEKNRTYPNSYDERNRSDVLKLRARHGGLAAYGRWEATKQLLLDEGGRIDLAQPECRALLRRELEVTDRKLDEFFNSCAEFGLISDDLYKMGVLASEDIRETLDYKDKKSSAGKQGGREPGGTNDA